MTPEQFRRFALRFRDAVEHAHFGHPDFRVGSRIFATLGYPDVAFGVLKLTPEQQQLFMAAAPDAFLPSKGAWGASGSTLVRLAAVAPAMLQDALTAAWHDAASKAKPSTKNAAATRRTSSGAAATKKPPTKRARTKPARTSRKKATKKSGGTAARVKTKRVKTTRASKSKTATKRPAKRASTRPSMATKR